MKTASFLLIILSLFTASCYLKSTEMLLTPVESPLPRDFELVNIDPETNEEREEGERIRFRWNAHKGYVSVSEQETYFNMLDISNDEYLIGFHASSLTYYYIAKEIEKRRFKLYKFSFAKYREYFKALESRVRRGIGTEGEYEIYMGLKGAVMEESLLSISEVKQLMTLIQLARIIDGLFEDSGSCYDIYETLSP